MTQEIAPADDFLTPDPVTIELMRDPTLMELVTSSELLAEWGADARPSGLATVDADTLVIADNASGLISVIDRNTGEIVRTEDTGLGERHRGLTAMQGSIYFTHMTTRQVYRIDIAE